MNAIWVALSETPWWVYLLLVILIKRGIAASQLQVVSLVKIFILPVIFIIFSVHTLTTAFQLTLQNILFYAGNVLLGALIGWLSVRNDQVIVDRKNGLIQLPGSWLTLILIIVIFAAKYYFSYALSADPALATESIFELSMLAVSGIVTGLFVGRVIFYTYRMMTSPSVDLSQQKTK